MHPNLHMLLLEVADTLLDKGHEEYVVADVAYAYDRWVCRPPQLSAPTVSSSMLAFAASQCVTVCHLLFTWMQPLRGVICMVCRLSHPVLLVLPSCIAPTAHTRIADFKCKRDPSCPPSSSCPLSLCCRVISRPRYSQLIPDGPSWAHGSSSSNSALPLPSSPLLSAALPPPDQLIAQLLTPRFSQIASTWDKINARLFKAHQVCILYRVWGE